MDWFGSISAPTAALLGGLGGFIADNVTGVVQRRLKRRHEQEDRIIEWYETTIQLAKEIKLFNISHKTALDSWSSIWGENRPTESEVYEEVDGMSVSDFKKGEIELADSTLKGVFSVENSRSRPLTESDIDKEEMVGKIMKEIRNSRKDKFEEINEQIGNDMENYYEKLIRHMASSPMELSNDVHDSLIKLLSFCFGTSMGGMSDGIDEDLQEAADDLIELCEEKIEERS